MLTGAASVVPWGFALPPVKKLCFLVAVTFYGEEFEAADFVRYLFI